jgi:uncharacterized sulfatase
LDPAQARHRSIRSIIKQAAQEMERLAQDFLYIKNFAPDRWPMGSPGGVSEDAEPDEEDLETNTYAAFADMDSSPTKAWVIDHRHDPHWRPYYDSAFAKREMDELYDLKKDPEQIHNVATDPAYYKVKEQMAAQLLDIQKKTHDPRLEDAFDRPPYVNPNEKPPAAKKRKG